MRRNFNRLLMMAALATAVQSFAAEPPPPPPPPPPLEESGSIESSSSGEWAIKGQNALLDKSTGHSRKLMLSFFLGIPFSYYGYGAYVSAFSLDFGMRFYFPIVKEGFLPMLNDSFGIEFGADTILVLGGYGYNAAFALAIPIEARWNFHIFPRLEAYAKLGGGVGFFFGNYLYPYPVFVVSTGILFKVNDVLWLRAEVGYPSLKVGLGLAF